MPRSTETHCSPRYSPLIVLYVLSARITATRIAANKSGKRRAETRRVYDLHRYYTRIIFYGSRTTNDRQRRQSRGTANIQAREAVVFLPFIRRRRRRILVRQPVAGNIPNGPKYLPRLLRPGHSVVSSGEIFLSNVEPPRDHHLASFYQRAEGERGVSRITR